MISKSDAAKQNDIIHADIIASAEKVIDRALASGYASGRSVTIEGPINNLDYHLRAVILARYKKAGWNIKHYDSQREGSSYTFS